MFLHHDQRSRVTQPFVTLVIGGLLALGPIAASPAHAEGPPATSRSTETNYESAEATKALARLVDLAAERLMTADQVAASKWISGKPIEDSAREEQVLEAMNAEAQRLHLDQAVVRQIFKDQIEANKLVQQGLHDRWKDYPQERPDSAPDLDHIRDEINRANTAILTALQESQSILRTPLCPTLRDNSTDSLVHDQHLNNLHTQGLQRALSGMCSAQ
ncbi:chorismate mutase [Streptomyces luteireticuli]|uniref:chorismate mutase n=1 Tax=Streptomyces luteireticuli TaxID=173858 RepID=UPI0035583061